VSNHLDNINNLSHFLQINNVPLDNVAYMVNKDEAEELYEEARGLSFSVLSPTNAVKHTQSMYKYERLHGAMYDGIRILVFDDV